MGEIRLDKMSGACPGFYPALFLESGMKKQQNDFLNGSILPSLLRFAGPVLLALFLQAMYGAVDLIVVGKFAGTADISAVSTGSQAMQLVTSLLVGLTTGVTVLLGQKIGEGKPDEAGSVIGSAICLFVCVALGLTALLVTLAAPFCRLLQAPEEAFDPTTQYVRICSAGTLFIVAFNVIGSVFRGLGDSKMPLITVAIACVVNIFGDLLLVAVFHLGAAGRAGRRVVPGDSGDRQLAGIAAVGRHGHRGEGLRVRRAHPGVVLHVPPAERAPVLHRPCHPLLDRRAGPPVPCLLRAPQPPGKNRPRGLNPAQKTSVSRWLTEVFAFQVLSQIVGWLAASMILTNFSGTRDAPPMRPPSMSGWASRS